MNLYYPDHWVEEISNEIEYTYGTGRTFSSSFAGLCIGLIHVDTVAYQYAAIRALVNLGVPAVEGVPAWVYTHPRNPNKGVRNE